jgi:hypothetical protein
MKVVWEFHVGHVEGCQTVNHLHHLEVQQAQKPANEGVLIVEGPEEGHLAQVFQKDLLKRNAIEQRDYQAVLTNLRLVGVNFLGSGYNLGSLEDIFSNGKVILDGQAGQASRQVFKQTTAWMLVDMLTNAVESGTGTRAQIDGITVAGKTGTNQDYRSAYFAGMTGYYTAVVWVGDDDYAVKLESGSSGGKVAAPLWQAFMSKILEGKPDRLIISASPIELGLVQRTVCTVSGKLATSACYADPNGHVPVTEWFDAANAPTEACDMHVLASICSASGQPASVYCPASQVSVTDIVLIRPDSLLGRYDQTILATYLPNAVFTNLTAAEYLQYAETSACSLHSPSWGGGNSLNGMGGDVFEQAKELIAQVQKYLADAQNLSDTDRNTLETGIAMLQQFIDAGNETMVQSYYERLQYNYAAISAANPPAATAEPTQEPEATPTPGGEG